MARQARLDAAGALHHVIGRGIDGTEIFAQDADRNDFLNRLADLCRQEVLIIYAGPHGQSFSFVGENGEAASLSGHAEAFDRLRGQL